MAAILFILCLQSILEAILPFFLKHLQSQSKKKDSVTAARLEIQSIHQLAGCMKALINNCEALTKYLATFFFWFCCLVSVVVSR